MCFTIENQGTNTYLVYKIGEQETIDSMSLGMLTNNKIAGLSSVQFMQMDSEKYIKYNITSHVAVKQFLSGMVNKKRVIGVFKGIVNALLSAEEYMIDINTIIIDTDYIFADVSSCETILICLPIIGAEQKLPDMGAFFKNIVFSTQFDATENCDYVTKFINYFNSSPVFSLMEFKSLIDDIELGMQNRTIEVQSEVRPVSQPVMRNTEPAIGIVPETASTDSKVNLEKNNAVQSPVQQPMQPAVQQPTQPPVQKQVQKPSPKPVQQQSQRPVNSNLNKMAIPNQGSVPNQNRVPSQNRVPNQTAVPSSQSANNAVPPEKEISWFYLMQHYNKENADAYKAQKEYKKQAKAVKKNSAPQNQPQVPVNQSQTPVNQAPVQQRAAKVSKGYDVPNQPVQPPVQTTNTVQNQNYANQGQAVAQQQNYTPNYASQPSQAAPNNFGETTILQSGSGETTVLGASPQMMQAVPHLIRVKNNERIPINKNPFKIGKERSYADYFIGDNTAISRSHANIVTRGQEYFVYDTNSTNHVFVNGSMIQSSIEVKISHGDKIRLANEEFEFKLY